MENSIKEITASMAFIHFQLLSKESVMSIEMYYQDNLAKRIQSGLVSAEDANVTPPRIISSLS